MTAFVRIISCLSLTLLLTACVSEPYQRPDSGVPEAWREQMDHTVAGSPSRSSKSEGWWKQLNDEALNGFMNKAVENNNDLKIAGARIAEAKALRGETFSKLLPDISATASANRTGKQSSLGGVDAANTTKQAGLNANWELDVFGGTRAELEAGDAGTLRAEAEYHQTKLLLLAEVARSYVETRTLQQLAELTQRNLTLQQETLRATRLQYDAQAVSKLDVVRAEAQVESTAAELPAIDATLAASRHRLSVLIGEAPGSVDALLEQSQPIPEFNEEIMLDTPIAVIAARPDVQAAEYRLMEATSLKNAASTEIFPKLTLSGFLGLGDATLYGASNPYSFGASALLPLLNFRRIESRIDAADARKMQALHAYKQTVLKALEEVENALVSYDREIKRGQSLQKAADSDREAARLARIKYQAGDATFLDLLIAEQRQLDAESAALASRAGAAKNAIALNTALASSESPLFQSDSSEKEKTP